MSDFGLNETYYPVHCPTCGLLYALPRYLGDHRKEIGEKLYCPNGHPWTYKTTEVGDLKEKVFRLEAGLCGKVRECAQLTKERAYATDSANEWKRCAEEFAVQAGLAADLLTASVDVHEGHGENEMSSACAVCGVIVRLRELVSTTTSVSTTASTLNVREGTQIARVLAVLEAVSTPLASWVIAEKTTPPMKTKSAGAALRYLLSRGKAERCGPNSSLWAKKEKK